MDNQYTSWWQEVLIWGLTTLVLGFYIALTFFAFRGDWSFLNDFEYWTVTISSTSIAWFLRFLWSNKGLTTRLVKNESVKEVELGKGTLVQEVNSRDLTDLLEIAIKETNKREKIRQYKNKCELKKRHHTGRRFFKGYHKNRYDYWKQQRIEADKDTFNVDIVRVSYYKYDIDSMLASTYKPTKQTELRGNIKSEIVKSYRTTILTMIAFGVLGALQVFIKDFSGEDLFVLLGRMLVFGLNIYSGFNLGVNFVDGTYSRDLTKDYVFLKSFLKQNKKEVN